MRILASVCGIGLGHSTRIFSILEKLKKEAELSVVASKISYKYLKDRGYKPSSIMEVDLKGDEFAVHTIDSIIENLDFPIQILKNYPIFSEIIEKSDPDLIFCDTEPTSFLMSRIKDIKLVSLTNYISSLSETMNIPKKFMKRETKTQLNMMQRVTDAMVKYSDLTLNISINQRESLSKKIKNIGLVIRKQPGDLLSDNYLKSKIRQDDFYLVSFGGAPLGTTLFKPLLKELKKFNDKKFIVSSSYKVEKIQKIGNITVFPFIDNYLEYLKICNGVISLAGFSTISETLAYKKPSLVIPIRNHIEQLLNAQLLKDLKLAETCLIEKDFSLIERKLKSFFNREDELQQRILKSKLNTHGADDAAEIILSMKN